MNIGKSLKFLFITFLTMILFVKGIYLMEVVPLFVAVCGIMGIFITTISLIFYKDKMYAVLSKIEKQIDKISYRNMLLLASLFSLLTKLGAIFLLDIQSINAHSDILCYVVTAKEIANTGIAEQYAGYCYNFSHMYWFAMFLSPIVKLFGTSQRVLSIFMAIVSMISTILLFDTAAKIFCKKRAFIFAMFYILLPSSIIIPQYITHEHALLFYISLALWIYSRILLLVGETLKRAILFLLFAVSLFLGFEMNIAGLIMSIAFIIVSFISENKEFKYKEIIILLLIFLAGVSCFKLYQLEHSTLKSSYIPGDKLVWTLYVGSNADTNAHWSAEDVERYDNFDANLSNEEILQYRVTLLKNRYKALFSNPLKLLQLIRGKLVTIWSTFTYPIMYTSETISKTNLQQIYNSGVSKMFVFIEYALSVFGVAFGIISNWCWKSENILNCIYY